MTHNLYVHAGTVAPALGTRALVAGASGMLRAATLALARSGWHVTAIARSEESLAAMASEAASSDARLAPLALDLRDGTALRAQLGAAVAAHGPFALTIAWLPAGADDALDALAGATQGRFVHVLGSAAEDPSSSVASARHRHESPLLRWQDVVLGFVRGRDGSRWLTNAEISSGVLTALATGEARSVVGTVRPWSARPGT